MGSSEELGIEVTFESLVGEHILDAVDESTESIKQWSDSFEDCNVIRFRLDGNVYNALEDPDDGYRSCLDRLYLSPCKMKNEFTPCKVLARIKTKGDYGASCSILELVDVVTGLIVLEVGTDNDDDYYPSFVASWAPQNMASNITARAAAD